MKSRVLFVTPVYPAPGASGSPRRAHAVLQALALRHDVSVLHIGQTWKKNAAQLIPPDGCSAYHYLPPDAGLTRALRLRRQLAAAYPRLTGWLTRRPIDWSEDTPTRLRLARELLQGADFHRIHAFRLTIANFALAAAATSARRPALHLDIDDIESATHLRLAVMHANNQANRAKRHERFNARAYASLERFLYPRFDRLYVCSETDAAHLRSSHPDVRVLPNTVAVSASIPPPADTESPFRFFFIGTLSYQPNQDGLHWFCREILPTLRVARACELHVAGLHAPDSLRTFLQDQPGVVYHGPVPDSATAHHQANAVIAPLRAGGGTRIKILEAFAQGRPVVTTSLGIEGIEARAGEDHLVADSADHFIRACLRLIDEPVLRSELAHRAHALVRAHYSPSALVAPTS